MYCCALFQSKLKLYKQAVLKLRAVEYAVSFCIFDFLFTFVLTRFLSTFFNPNFQNSFQDVVYYKILGPQTL